MTSKVMSRLPVVGIVVACVAGVVAAVSGAANPVSAVQFLLPGHWIYNSSLQSVFHVDGSTGDVDAHAQVPGSSGDQVFQGDTSGYVVGKSRITEFGKSSLSVAESTSPPSRHTPVGVETAGGPYLVYQEDGKVVRLGEPSTVLSLGGPVGMPVATRDGTLWLPRTSVGLLCQLPARTKNVSCPILLPKGHSGALSVVGDRVMFVDTTDDTVQVVEKDGLGVSHELGIDAHDDARLAGTDVEGRIAILDGEQLHLVDADLSADEPVTVALAEGEYAGPVSTGSVVAVVNRTTSTLVTYDSKGKLKQTKELPPEHGDPRLTRGEDDRIYVDGAEGQHVVVVDKDGDLTDVPITDKDIKEKAPPTGGKDPDEQVATPKPETTSPPVETPKPQTQSPPVETPKPQTQSPPAQTSPPKTNPPSVEPQPDPEPQDPPAVPPSPPGAPTGVNATAGDATATVTWGPAQANRSPVTGYRITWPGGQTTTTANTATITGLANGTSYVFTVTALSAAGVGPGAASNPVTPVAPVRPASEPTNLIVNYDNGNAAMAWNQPADLGGGTLSHYVVSVTDHADVTVTTPAAVIDNITATGTITFTVRAVTTNASGQQLVGAPATTSVEAPVDNGTIALTRGPATQEICAGDPDCAWMHIVLSNMRPNTAYTLTSHSSNPGYASLSATVTTDANGNAVTDKFAYHEEGETVWVTGTPAGGGTETRSNDLVWQAAG